MTLPTGIGYTTIRGKYISAVLDGADADREPDVVPQPGLTITLTASISPPILKSLTDPPVSILLTPIVAHTDDNGIVIGPDGQPDILIVASDFPDPAHPWTYAVTIQGSGFPKLSFNIVAHSGEIIDLTNVLESPSSPTDLSAWEALAIQVTTDADRAEAAAEASSGPAGGDTGQLLAKASPADFDTVWIDPPTGGTGGAVDSVAGRTGAVVLSADDLTDATTTGKAVVRAASASAARTAIGAGTSSLALGTTSSTAKAGDYQPTAANISDATTTGRSVLTASSAAAARTAIGAGTSNVAIGTTAGTAADAQSTSDALAGKEPTVPAGTSGQYYDGTKTWKALPTGGAVTADSITDATAVGKSLIRATDAPTARTAIGAGTSNLALGTTAGTAKAGNYQPVAADISDATATGRSVITAASAAAARTAIGAGTSNVAIGTTAGTAADAAALATSLAGKEPNLPAGGNTTQYLRGDKTWQTLPAGGGAPTLDNLPAGTLHVQIWDGTATQPVRETARTDIPVEWRQPTAPPAGGNYAVAGMDSWVVTS